MKKKTLFALFLATASSSTAFAKSFVVDCSTYSTIYGQSGVTIESREILEKSTGDKAISVGSKRGYLNSAVISTTSKSISTPESDGDAYVKAKAFCESL